MPSPSNGDGSRVFLLDNGNVEQIVVAISGLTLTGGDTAIGGAILNMELLEMARSTISGNFSGGKGGGIYTDVVAEHRKKGWKPAEAVTLPPLPPFGSATGLSG